MKREIIDNAKLLNNVAQDDFYFSPEKDQNSRFIQAFLLQSTIIEGLMREFANDLNKGNKIQGVKQSRTFYQSCREVRIVGGINKENFTKLLSYIDFRNNLVHKVLEKNDLKILEKEINDKYSDGSDIINILM